MKTYSVDTSVQYLKGVGPKMAGLLKNLGIDNIDNLLTLVPRRYARKSLIKDLKLGEEARVSGRIIETHTRFTSKGKIFIVRLSDGTGNISCYFFNYSPKMKEKFKWNTLIEVEGQVSLFGRGLQLVNPSISFSPSNGRKLLPIYPLTYGLTHTYIRRVINGAFESGIYIPETLPTYIVEHENLLPKEIAIKNLHFPDSLEVADMARKRLEFEELFYLEILLALRKKWLKNKGIKFKKGSILARKFFDLMRDRNPGFKLTKAQHRVIWEIFGDMESESRMNRLLQGDVGSGKTIVAILSMLKAVESGYQAVLMAPTEILAEQHYFCLKEYLPEIGVNLGILVGSQSQAEKQQVKEELKTGKIQVVVGTHALIEESSEFKNLGFIVIDEQHKFGVMQRVRLIKKGVFQESPDVLVMTATPIPRSLSLTIYGDLDISVIDELPPGRRPIITRWMREDKINEVWVFVKRELDAGRQCYIVYPIIEESEKTDLKAAQESYEKLSRGVFKDYNIGLLHGRLKGEEKEKVMEAFRAGDLNILITTTVIEVGIDIKNATCMVIEHAERFGISQLHQLRGRIGRGAKQSYCILVSPRQISDISKERLKTIENENDGFKLAEKDLQLRGPGEFFGTRQHGLPELRLANPIYNVRLLSLTRNLAFKVISQDPELQKIENRIIKKTINHKYRNKLEFLEAG
ncbi:ATP-dependent DNA helicase RecG [candidate division WOR-3 bacterium]|nr:ATP-dependent DNA helicase RecG [candidate division WOR-3 bacterium]